MTKKKRKRVALCSADHSELRFRSHGKEHSAVHLNSKTPLLVEAWLHCHSTWRSFVSSVGLLARTRADGQRCLSRDPKSMKSKPQWYREITSSTYLQVVSASLGTLSSHELVLWQRSSGGCWTCVVVVCSSQQSSLCSQKWQKSERERFRLPHVKQPSLMLSFAISESTN